jgi:hypothetical protein
MWKETAIRVLIGLGGLVLGGLFVLILNGAALAGAERLHLAHARAHALESAIASEPSEDFGTLAESGETKSRRVH